MASQNPHSFQRGQDSVARTGVPTCPYCCQPLAALPPDTAPPSGIRSLLGPDTSCNPVQRSMCLRCRLLFDVDSSVLAPSDHDRSRVLVAAYRARRAHDRFRADHADRFRAVSELAEAFLGLAGAPGVRPFAANILHNWACEQPLDEGVRAAVAFVLHVADAGARWKLRFEVVSAMKVWDAAQRAVFVEWARMPWWA